MAWSSTGVNKRKLNLKFRLAMRRSARWIANTNVGSRYYAGTIKWGDGKRNRAGPFRVNPGGIDKVLDFSDSTGVMSHTYSASFLQQKQTTGFYITYQLCCRISNSRNNRDRSFRIWTYVNTSAFLSGEHGPFSMQHAVTKVPSKSPAAKIPYVIGHDKEDGPAVGNGKLQFRFRATIQCWEPASTFGVQRCLR
eukprot:g8199.t1